MNAPEELLFLWTRTLWWSLRRFEAESRRAFNQNDPRDARRVCWIYMILSGYVLQILEEDEGFSYGNWLPRARVQEIIDGIGGEFVRYVCFPLKL